MRAQSAQQCWRRWLVPSFLKLREHNTQRGPHHMLQSIAPRPTWQKVFGVLEEESPPNTNYFKVPSLAL